MPEGCAAAGLIICSVLAHRYGCDARKVTVNVRVWEQAHEGSLGESTPSVAKLWRTISKSWRTAGREKREI